MTQSAVTAPPRTFVYAAGPWRQTYRNFLFSFVITVLVLNVIVQILFQETDLEIFQWSALDRYFFPTHSKAMKQQQLLNSFV